MTIRTAAPEDIEVLASLEAVCFDEPWTERALAEALHDAKYLILISEIDSGVVAYAIGWNVGVEAELARVGVLPSWRGKGWGEGITIALLQGFQNLDVREVFLEVRVSNTTAQRLYERCGFERIGLRRNYYADGEDAVVMRSNIERLKAPPTASQYAPG